MRLAEMTNLYMTPGDPEIVNYGYLAFEEHLPGKLSSRQYVAIMSYSSCPRLTAHVPATEATMPPEIIIGRTPLVLLKTAPEIPPAAMLLNESCFPL